jgi:hypothetical protein
MRNGTNLLLQHIKLLSWCPWNNYRMLRRVAVVSYVFSFGQVYDVTDQVSFNNAKQWLQEIERYASENVRCITSL